MNLLDFLEFIRNNKEANVIDNFKKIELLRKELENLYLKEGVTDKVLKLSQKLDEELCKIQKKQLKL